MAFAPSWTLSVSSYDATAPVPIKRAQEIFPNDFIKLFVDVLEAVSTAKVAKFTIKDLAKKNGGKGGLHDMFLDRAPELCRKLTGRQFKHGARSRLFTFVENLPPVAELPQHSFACLGLMAKTDMGLLI